MSSSGANGESHVDATKNVVRAGLAVEKSLAFVVTLQGRKNSSD
jgi:hypothetical protein